MNQIPESHLREHVRVLACIADTERFRRLGAVLSHCPGFELLGRYTDLDATLAALASLDPDILVIEFRNRAAEERARTRLRGCVVPSLSFIDEDTQEAVRSSQLSRLPASMLDRADTVSQSFVRTRLQLLGARAIRSRRTVTRRSLGRELAAFRERMDGTSLSRRRPTFGSA